jgi:twinkle protein
MKKIKTQDFQEYIRDEDNLKFFGQQESQYLESPEYFLDEWIKFDSNAITGDILPWPKMREIIQFRPHEVSLWGGINGHGKSMVLNQAILHWMSQGKKAVIASLEMHPYRTLERMCKQTGLTKKPTESFKADFASWSEGKLWIYDQLDQVPFDRILGMVYYAAMELKADHIVIDSLMKCGISDDDYAGQKDFVDSLCWAAKKLNTHIHLVVHMRKNGSENDRPGKFDVLGASAITNLVDQLLIIHRNKNKEEDIEEGKEVGEFMPDSSLAVKKNRHSGTEGAIALYFDTEFLQYSQNPNYAAKKIQIPCRNYSNELPQ